MTEATPLASEQITQDVLKNITTELLSHRGEQPYRVLRGGQELWETWLPAVQAALRYLPALSASSAPSGQGVSGEVAPWSAKDAALFPKHQFDRYDRPRTCERCDYVEHDGSGIGWHPCSVKFVAAPAPSCAPGEVERALSALDRFIADQVGNDDTCDGIAVDEAAQEALATLRAAFYQRENRK